MNSPEIACNAPPITPPIMTPAKAVIPERGAVDINFES